MGGPETAGRYRIVRLIGRGAMGRVYLAKDPQIDRFVALKTISDESGLDPAEQEAYRSRIISEAQAAGRLLHPNIVTIFDVFEDGGATFIAMEYLEGTTLDKLCSKDRMLPLGKILDIVSQTLSALDYAHRRGIVHRDIKPSNIMVLDDGTVKITDFGLAKRLGAPLSQDGFLVGTPHYMSPEQVDGKLLDGRSDLFSLGIVLYELVCGIRPFDGETISTILKKILFEEPPEPVEPGPAVPSQLFGVIRKALAKNPAERFRDAREFQETLNNYSALRTAVTARRNGALLPPPPPPKAEKKVKYSVDWKVVAIAGASGGIFTLLLLFGIQFFLSADGNPLSLRKPANEEVLPKPVEVRTDPPGALLYLDGKKVQIPILSPNDRGRHRLAARKGCLSAETEITAKTPSPLILRLFPRPFQFKIDSEPQGALVFVNGEETGFRTPALIPRADCGSFNISLKLEGCADASKEITPSETESVFLTLTQKAPEGKLRLASEIPSFRFFEGDRNLGGPGAVIDLPEGEHRIRMIDPEVLGSREVKVTVAPGETTELSGEPFRTGTVFIVGHPEEDGTVNVDGRKFGDLPLTGERRLAVGKHEITVVSSKGRSVHFEWKIREGEQRRLVDFAKKKVSDI